MNKASFLTLLGLLTVVVHTHTSSPSLFPNIADITHATPEAASFFHGYFTAKSNHNATAWLTYFNPIQVGYYDAVVGYAFSNRSQVVAAFTPLLPTWGPPASNASSYPLIIWGDTTSAIVHFVDGPALFGVESRSIAAYDFKDGLIIREVDYWDGRHNPEIALAVPDDEYPVDLGLDGVPESAATEMSCAAHELQAAFSAANATAAAALFSVDAVFVDMTLRTREEGALAIGRYLQRVLPYLPYGSGSTVRHVLGSAKGGGYEWETVGELKNGISALELDESGKITMFMTVWDGSRMNDTAIESLAALSLEA
jgi:hypothetical protein